MEKKYRPFEEIARIEDIVDRTLARAFIDFPFPRRWKVGREERLLPTCDLIDKGEYLLLRAEVPGLTREKLDISVDEVSISISGEIKREKEEESSTYYRSERYYGEFSRVIDLPTEVNPNAVDATLKEGILEVKLPKKRISKARRVDIQIK